MAKYTKEQELQIKIALAEAKMREPDKVVKKTYKSKGYRTFAYHSKPDGYYKAKRFLESLDKEDDNNNET